MEIRFYKKQHAGRLSKAGAAHAPVRAAGSGIRSSAVPGVLCLAPAEPQDTAGMCWIQPRMGFFLW